MAAQRIQTVDELQELIIQELAVVIRADEATLRAELLGRGPSMPADSYQLLEVIRKLGDTLEINLDVDAFHGYLKSVRRAATRLHEVIKRDRSEDD